MIGSIDQAIQMFIDQFGAASARDTRTRATYSSAVLTWRRSLVEKNILPETFPLHQLNRSAVTDFAVWLTHATYQRRHSTKPPTPYSPASVRLFVSVLRGALAL